VLLRMRFSLRKKIVQIVSHWLTREAERESSHTPLYDFDRLCYELRPGDVLLTEGRSHVAEVIKLTTQSPWTHSVLYIGRLYDVEDLVLRETLQRHFNGDPNEQLIIEAMLGEGTIVTPLKNYHQEHIRICRPKGLAPVDAQKVIAYAISQIGKDYDVRQILDLLRFMFPYSIVPRRWRSSLFGHNAGNQTRTVCSTMMAEAFHAVNFPILPFASKTPEGAIKLHQRNPRLFTPKDFDYSPYFDIIKYPFFGIDDISIYKRLPWGEQDIYCNDANDCYIKTSNKDKVGSGMTEFAQKKLVKRTMATDITPDNSQNDVSLPIGKANSNSKE